MLEVLGLLEVLGQSGQQEPKDQLVLLEIQVLRGLPGLLALLEALEVLGLLEVLGQSDQQGLLDLQARAEIPVLMEVLAPLARPGLLLR